MPKKVSIIIPTYNRAHLILTTLESIRNQDYINWECLIVDDHSTDNSIAVISEFIKKDNRFSLHIRPANRSKGANACRNYGFELSNGFYIQWFDSDDIMTQNHISSLIKAIIVKKLDFAIGDTYNFIEGKGLVGKPYNFDRQGSILNANNFGKQSIGCITDDFLGKREILKNIKFNEVLTDGDEYNLFIQLLHENKNGDFVNSVLTYRRLHKNTLSNREGLTDMEYYIKVATIKYLTFQDIEKYQNNELLCWFLAGYMQYSFKICLEGEFPPFIINSIIQISKYFGNIKAANFLTAIIFGRYSGRGYKFLKKATRY
jgi:glycosyltransferase involved in cell wall biosynthesis